MAVYDECPIFYCGKPIWSLQAPILSILCSNSSATNGVWHSYQLFQSYSAEIFRRGTRQMHITPEVINDPSPHLTFTQDDVCSILWSFHWFLLSTTLISGLSAAACSLLYGVSIKDLLLTAFLLLISSWSFMLCRILPPSKGAGLTLTSMFHRLNSVSFGSHCSQTCDSCYIIFYK
ncbi:hypothetical protein RO3G_04102 [Rhizopus delemar RA 99-880]|uniref:Uncharacterized protein n=1 Tax=Rhizopus delemar (strain RA 99-880 / ATCC MYA-4621 / FGSC 9543 / NRRL 43880) TaxID=246409 RepID=I1BT67_RHIO9|nr:hypothetical protein RO3G_04102 [Rhizopus delemar RA 99-880]|eukprot:EIE79397.1 hypothetical protein RO3G_04102 [Rhizopus delemar RA 99-880]